MWVIVGGYFDHVTGTTTALLICDYKMKDLTEIAVAGANVVDIFEEPSANASGTPSIFKNRAFAPIPITDQMTLICLGDATSGGTHLMVLELPLF